MSELVKEKFGTVIDRTQKNIDDETYKNRNKKHPEDFTRERKMPFKNLIYFMLTSIKCSSQNALERYFEKVEPSEYMTQQSFSEARQKINYTAFSDLFEMTVDVSYEYEYKTWHGYRVFAIDGSKISLPNDPILKAYFGTAGAGGSSATAQGSILYDVYNKVVADAGIEPIKTDERTLAQRHIQNLVERIGKSKRDLILFDRGYASFELIEQLGNNGIDFLMRVRKKFNLEIDAMSDAEGIVILKKKGHKDIPVRVIKFELESGEIEVLITSLQDKRMKTKAFKELYFKRWPVESKYDEIKNKLEIENFSGRTALAIQQDFYATMYLTNVAMMACEQAQEQVDERHAHKDNKYEYQVNVNHAIGVIKDRLILLFCVYEGKELSDEVTALLRLLAKKVSPKRPGRSTPRELPRKTKFHHNRKSNC